MILAVKSGNTYIDLTAELTSIRADDEIIWSSNTGRTTTGKMLGTVIAEKKNIELAWGVCDEDYVKKIKKYMCSGFFTVKIRDAGEDVEMTCYRGTLAKEHIGYVGDGKYYYRSINVSLVQQ